MTEAILLAIVSMLLAFYATRVAYGSYTKETITYVDDIVAFTDKGHRIYAPKDVAVGDIVLVGQIGDCPYIVRKVKERKGETK